MYGFALGIMVIWGLRGIRGKRGDSDIVAGGGAGGGGGAAVEWYL